MKSIMKQWILFFGLALVVFWVVEKRGLGEADKALPASWSEDFGAATARARAESKPMLLVFSTSWCGPCKSMKARVYSEPKVEAALADWVPVYVDGDKQRDILQQFEIRSYPSYVVLNPQGQMAGGWVGGMGVNAFVGKLKEAEAAWAN